MKSFDILIVGSGAAGLTAALNLAGTHKVAVIAKGALGDSASARAQGGIAAVLEEGDSFDAHVNDTMIAGAGLNDLKVVEHVVEHAPAAIRRLIDLGVPFASENGALHLTREGGHSHRRIVHVADATGWAICRRSKPRRRSIPNITLVPDMVAIDLVTGRHEERYSRPAARSGALCAQPQDRPRRNADRPRDDPGNRRRGARLPLFDRAARRDRRRHRHGVAGGLPRLQHGVHAVPPDLPLQSRGQELPITEAVRGEGGQLKHPGTRPAARASCRASTRAPSSPRATSSPAPSTTRSSASASTTSTSTSATATPDFVKAHFPNIYDKLLGLGIDITQGADPGRPGAALHLRRHGHRPRRRAPTCPASMRPAKSPSGPARRQPARVQLLLECLVFGEAAAKHIVANWNDLPDAPALRAWDESRVTDSDEEVVIAPDLGRDPPLHVELCRHRPHHQAARARPAPHRHAPAEIEDYYAHFRVTPDLIELGTSSRSPT